VSRRILVLLLALAAPLAAAELATPDPRALIGPPHGQPPASAAVVDAQTRAVSELLRCPVCQGLSVADSPVGLAVNMRQQVREMVAVGYDEEQILSYFEKSYGEFVRLEPPLRGVNWLVWAGPLGALLLGGIWVSRALRQRHATAPESQRAREDSLPGRDTLPGDKSLATYVLQVRERAYGWPGGAAPGVTSHAHASPGDTPDSPKSERA
jgi:cytochrome c-type biogenesis protein CcmH